MDERDLGVERRVVAFLAIQVFYQHLCSLPRQPGAGGLPRGNPALPRTTRGVQLPPRSDGNVDAGEKTDRTRYRTIEPGACPGQRF
jgi:hypothetical protein